MFSLRIVSTSHYQAEPLPEFDVVYSSFRSNDVRKVPILRIFGATPAGQKTCMHVHGVFPYLYVPYDGTQPADSYLRRFAVSLDKAINVANNSSANVQHVFKISLVSGIPMYGYHEEEEQFLKIYLYNPSTVRKAADLLLGGAVMNKSFQPHEAHIPFPLQLFIDYNLYGMNLVNVAAVKFRRSHKADGDAERSKPSSSAAKDSGQEKNGNYSSTPSFCRTPSSTGSANTPCAVHWDLDNVPSEMLLPSSIERQSVCELEVDVMAADILNRREVTDNMGSNPGLAALWEDERQRRRDVGQASQIGPQESQVHDNVECSTSERELLQRLNEIIQKQRGFSQSESEESAVSMEDTTLTPEDVTYIPASQLENHSQSVPDTPQSSQDTVIVEEEREREGEGEPIISLESIQRVVSFSQSFSRSNSQPTSTPPDGEGADQSLVDILAALAEESSPSSSQRCAAQITALEEQDSVVGQEVPLPPDSEVLKEDEEETLHMSQTLPQEADSGSEHFDMVGMDESWNGSSEEEKDVDLVMESDEKEEEDDDNIPQLDGASDEKPVPKKKGKKRLGVRGPVLASTSNVTLPEGSAPQNEAMSSSSTGPQMQSSVIPGGGPPPHNDQGIPCSFQQQAGMEMFQSQHGGYCGRQQWGGPGNSGSMSPFSGHSPTAAGWSQSPPHQTGYRPHISGHGCYPYPQRYPHSPSFGLSGVQSSPRQSTFSPPPRSPMSPPALPNSGVCPGGPQTYVSTPGSGASGMRQHSDSSVSHPGVPLAGSPSWQYPSPGYSGGSSHRMTPPSPHSMPSASPHGVASVTSHSIPVGSPHSARFSQSAPTRGAPGMSPDGWAVYPGGHSPLQSSSQNLGRQGQFCGSSSQAETCHQVSRVSETHPGYSQAVTGQPKSSRPQTERQSSLQALLEAPEISRVVHSQCIISTDGSFHKRAMSVDHSPSASPAGSDPGGRVRQEFKLPEKRSGSFSGYMGAGSQSSALSSLCHFVSNVDPMAPTPVSSSRTSTPTSSFTLSPTPTSDPSPSIRSKEEEKSGSSSVGQAESMAFTSPTPSNPVDETVCGQETLLPASAKPLPAAVDKEGLAGFESSSKPELTSSAPDVSSASGAVAVKNERVGKQSRLKKLGLSLLKTRRSSEDRLGSPSTSGHSSAYTFIFHVPTPVYKRFKMRGIFPNRSFEDIKFVRMHPMDARKYSLLKIGRELVCLNRIAHGELADPCTVFSHSSKSGMAVPDDHNSQIDPHTGELYGACKAGGIGQSSRELVEDNQGTARKHMGPKSRTQATSDRDQTPTTLLEICETEKIDSASAVAQTGREGQTSEETGTFSDCPMKSVEPAQTLDSTDSSSMSWQAMDRDRRPSVKVDYPARHPQSGSEVGGGTGHWHSTNQPPWSSRASEGQVYNYPPVTGSDGSQQLSPNIHYPFKTWPGQPTRPPASTSLLSSPVAQPMQVASSSPSAQQGPSRVYSGSCPGYDQYGQQTAIMPGHQYNPGTVHGQPSMDTRHYTGALPQHGQLRQFPGQTYQSQGFGKERCQEGSYLLQQQQPGQYMQSPEQGQYMSPESAASFQHNGSFSPLRRLSPVSSTSTQLSTGPCLPQLSSAPSQLSQFSSQANRDQFLSQQNQFSSPASQDQFLSQQNQFSPGQFLSPSGQPGHLMSRQTAPCSSSQFGQFPSPSSHHGQFSPCTSQHSPMSPQMAYQGIYSPNASQQSQLLPPDGRQYRQNQIQGPVSQHGHSQYPSTSQASVGLAHMGSAAAPQDENSPFLDTENQRNPFLHQGACQVSTTSASDLAQPEEDHSKNMQPDRPAVLEKMEEHTDAALEEDRDAKDSLSVNGYCAQNLELLIAEDSDDDFCVRGHKKQQGKGRRSSSSSSVSGKTQNQTNNDSVPSLHPTRRSSVQLWSLPVDSCYSEDESEESDESSDDYYPASKLQWKGRKRKGSKQRRQTQTKRTKGTVVNSNCRVYPRIKLDADKKPVRRGKQGKNPASKNGKKGQQLIEGVHYIVVGKFKGHRIMLVKVDKVKVRPDQRVKVSEILGTGTVRSVEKTKPRLLGPRCRRLARGNLATDPCFVQMVDTLKVAGNDSDTTLIHDDLNSKSCADPADKVSLDTESGIAMPELGSEEGDGTLQEICDTDHSEEKTELTCCSQKKDTMNKESIEMLGDKVMKEESFDPEADTVEIQSKPELKSKSPSPVDTSNGDEGGRGLDDATDPPVSMEIDGDSRMMTSEPPSLAQSPLTKSGKRSSDSPFVISEHSQDADCSSLPQSNPDSTSSSPAFPRIAKDSELHKPSGADTELKNELCDRESKSAGHFCFQAVCDKVKEVRASQRVEEASSDSSDSHDCFSEVQAKGEDSLNDLEAVSFSWQDKLTSEVCAKSTEIDKDKLKKQRKLTTNQRLGVAFLSKRSRRRKSKVNPRSDVGVNSNSNKLMDSLSLLHMATLASLGSKQISDSSDLPYADKGQAEEKENHNRGPFESSADKNFDWKTLSFLRENCEWKSSVHTSVDVSDIDVFKMNCTSENAFMEVINSSYYNEEKVVFAPSEKTLGQKLVDESDTCMSVTRCEQLCLRKGENDHQDMSDRLRDQELKHEHSRNSANEKDKQDVHGECKKRVCEDSNDTTDELSQNRPDLKISGDSLDIIHEVTREDSKESMKRVREDSSDTADETVYEQAQTKLAFNSCEDSLDRMHEVTCEDSNEVSNLTKPQLFEDSDEKTDDYTVQMPKRCSNRQPSRYRKKRTRKRAKGRRTDRSATSKLLNSLDVLHMATLASLGTDVQHTERETSFPRYSDFVCDHSEDYEESLIRMSYTSPVHSDLGDLSPPIPMSPEELSTNNISNKKLHRPMPCRQKIEEVWGTRSVSMAQVRAENAAELSRMSAPVLGEKMHGINSDSSAFRNRTASSQPSVSKVLSSDRDTVPLYSGAVSTPVSGGCGHATALPKPSSSSQPTVPDPDKLPPPSIPWHHPLHVVTDCLDGGAWKDRVIHDALTEKHQSRNNSLGDNFSPSTGSHFRDLQSQGERMPPLSSASDRSDNYSLANASPYLAVSQEDRLAREPQASSTSHQEMRNDVTGGTLSLRRSYSDAQAALSLPLREICNRTDERVLPFSSLSERYAQRDRLLSGSAVNQREMCNSTVERLQGFSQRDPYSIVSVSSSSRNQLQDSAVSKQPLLPNVSQRDVQSLNPSVPPLSSDPLSGSVVDSYSSSANMQPYSSASLVFEEKNTTVTDSQLGRWPCETSNTGVAHQRPELSGDQNKRSSSQSHQSPRLSRTEMVLSKMFNLDTLSSAAEPTASCHSKSPKTMGRDRSADNSFGCERNGWKTYPSQKDSSQNKQAFVSAKSPASGKSPARSLTDLLNDQLYPSQRSATANLPERKSSVSSHSSQKSPSSYADKYCNNPKFSAFEEKHRIEIAKSPLGSLEKNKTVKSPSAMYSHFTAKSPVSNKDGSKPSSGHSNKLQSPSVYYHLSKSPSAYYDRCHGQGIAKSPGAYSSGSCASSKSPGYACEKPSNSFYLSTSYHGETLKENGNSSFNYTPERCSYSPRAYSQSAAPLKASASMDREHFSSKSPVASSPGSAFSSSGKSPCGGSPRGRPFDNGRYSKTDSLPHQNRKQSVGDYLEAMIESAYSKESPEDPRRQQLGMYAGCDTVASKQEVYPSLKTSCNDTVISSDVQPCGPGVRSTSIALDLSTCAKKDIPGTYASCGSSHLPSDSLAFTASSYSSSVSSVCKPTNATALSHPTWTSIKTDDFENITDDEDEEVIPSSQEYSTSAYRFPGFRRLSNISSSWTPYSVQNHSVPVVPRTLPHSANSVVSVPSHGYNNSLYKCDTGSLSQTAGISAGSMHSSQATYAYSSVASKPDMHNSTISAVLTQPSQSAALSMVSRYGTPWQDTQAQNSTQSSNIMSQFEPITDSEEEEGDDSSTSQTTPSKYGTVYSSAAYTSATRFPAYGAIRTTSSYSSLGNSTSAMMSHSTYPFLVEGASTGHTPLILQSQAGNTKSVLATGSGMGSLSAVGDFIPHISVPSSSYSMASAGASGGCYSGYDCGGKTGAGMTTDGGLLVCGGGDGDKHSDSDPEDGGGRKKKKMGGPPPSQNSSSSSSSGRRVERPADPAGPEGGHSNGRRKNDEQAESPDMKLRGHVLCPRALPPSRRAIEASAVSFGLSVEPASPAFCSNPADLPDTPRELGGRVLRLATNRVTELEEMPPSESGQGLRAWQSVLATESRLLCSQPDTSATPLAQRLQKEPQLRFALAGDRLCVIVPVRPPPSCPQVTAWLLDKVESIRSTRRRKDNMHETKVETDGGDVDTSLPLDIDVPVEESEGVGTRDSSDEDDSIFTRLRQRRNEDIEGTSSRASLNSDRQEDTEDGSSTPKRQRLDSDGILHSTPVLAPPSDLFSSGCTPISSNQRAGDSGRGSEETGGQFVTPKRPPLRRLSTNTESALRSAFLVTSNRQQSFEGEASQIDGPTPRNTHGFKVTQQNLQDAKALHKHQFLTVLSMELHADSRGDLMPDPEVDAIRMVFYAVFDDIPPEKGRRNITGAIVVDKDSCTSSSFGSSPRPSTSRASAALPGKGKRPLLEKCGMLEELDVRYVESEGELLKQFVEFINSLDPDILLGFEVQQLSWGFLLQRASHLSVNLCSQIARIKGSKRGSRFSAEKDEWGADHTSEIHIEGRVILNLWRVLRHEVTLNIYSYENCAFHILHQRVPAYTFRTLTSWYNHRTHLHRWRVVQYYTQRVTGQLAMLDQLDIIGKTSEFARVFGIEFYDVLSRGSQYRVESMMLRLAKPLNFIPVSPSVQQRARQKAPECIPLTLEPQSKFYTDPVVVLDFQSLYPSIMIAYNYCFSTCLGRMDNLSQAEEGPFQFGCTALNISPEILRKLRKKVTVSPNGCVFATRKVRRGILPMMVEEILKTRLMVKKSMKDYKDDKTLYRLLDARQLGLKLIANVTYGYTGASFSGRMPCIEVGDSIVRKARESLERAIQLVEETPHWQAQVVYGDTDSLFIKLPGRSKDEAFVTGQEIADTITNMFPKPMKLKFEKVYLPCALQTKKRYVGFMYETPDQKEPVFDAKGIETVRRDNCGVVSKVLERCIKILFTQRDVSQVRMYLQRQFTKMLSGRVGLQDFVFAKEYRGMMGYKPGACVPALEIARKRLHEDRRAEPRVGERVPYVIVHGSPGLPLIQLVRQPRQLLQDPSLRINVTYYITKQVLPPLDRLLGLVGVSVFQWYNDMPKVVRLAPHVAPAQNARQGTISQYFVTSDCLVCERQTKQSVCAICLKDPQLVAVTLASRAAALEAVQDKLAQVCNTCMGVQDGTQPCISLDCPVLFRRHMATLDLSRADYHREALLKQLSF